MVNAGFKPKTDNPGVLVSNERIRQLDDFIRRASERSPAPTMEERLADRMYLEGLNTARAILLAKE
jgi:hypothetical protein